MFVTMNSIIKEIKEAKLPVPDHVDEGKIGWSYDSLRDMDGDKLSKVLAPYNPVKIYVPRMGALSFQLSA